MCKGAGEGGGNDNHEWDIGLFDEGGDVGVEYQKWLGRVGHDYGMAG